MEMDSSTTGRFMVEDDEQPDDEDEEMLAQKWQNMMKQCKSVVGVLPSRISPEQNGIFGGNLYNILPDYLLLSLCF